MEEMSDLEKRPRILIVDDKPNNLRVISEILSEEYKLFTASDGEMTFELAEKNNPDLILLDVMMPQMDGFEICQKLLENSNTKDIPIIFLTAKNSTDDVIKGFSKGAVDYVKKPFNIEELLVRIKNHLQLKKAKEELKQTISQLYALNKEKDRFFSIISHDLKNPMGAVLGLSKMLIMDIENNNPEGTNLTHILKTLNLIHQGTDTVYKLLENLLTWSRLQTGKIKINKEKFLINEAVTFVIEFCQNLAKSKNIRLNNDINNDITLYADANMLNTVLRNIIINAIKFTHKNGEIRIKASVKEDKVTIAIKDTGIGMSQDTIDKLFKIGETIKVKGTEKETGTGLGLVICQDFIEKHGGRIWAESQIGNGSTFFFTLPMDNISNNSLNLPSYQKTL